MEASARRRRVHRAAWAASIVAAVAFGWTANQLAESTTTGRVAGEASAPSRLAVSRQPASNDSRTATAAPAVLRPAVADSAATPPARRPGPGTRRAAARAVSPQVSIPPAVPPAELELSTVNIPRAGDFELDGMWRTVSWAGAQQEAGDKLPHIDGLPVVQVQVQSGKQGKQPLMVVAQQLSSGEVIRTIEGPASDVSHLLARRTMSDPDPSVLPVDSTRSRTARPYQGVDGTMAMQRGDRMIAITGALPPDSLLAMIRRLNAEMRSK
jgi:hypothetical protein